MKKLEVGMTFRVFEAVNTEQYYNFINKYSWSIEVPNRFLGNKYGVDLYGNESTWHLGIDERKDARLVGRLIIKSVK